MQETLNPTATPDGFSPATPSLRLSSAPDPSCFPTAPSPDPDSGSGDPSCPASDGREPAFDGGSDDSLERQWGRQPGLPTSIGGRCSVLEMDLSGVKMEEVEEKRERLLADHVKDWVERKVSAGVPDRDCSLVLERDWGGVKEEGERSLADHVRAWVEGKVAAGVPERQCLLPFLANNPKTVECRLCNKDIYTGEEVRCSVVGCQEAFHRTCAKDKIGLSIAKPFKCPRHGCFICKQKAYWRCIRCTIAAHTNCAPWPEDVIILANQSSRAVCWRHPSNWLFEHEHADMTRSVEEAFHRLPLPYTDEEFNAGLNMNNSVDYKTKRPPDEHKSCNGYVVNKKHEADCGADSTSKEDIERRNNPFCKEKSKVVEEASYGLALPHNDELKTGSIVNYKDNKTVPSPYKHIRRNVYLVKKKRDNDSAVGCRDCSAASTCKEDCECRGLSISCSKACYCSDMCTNKPFRKEKKIKVVKTELCGWGVVALEAMEKGDFVVEYIGEVIDDATCEQRLWDMKWKGDRKFYMCEISKDLTIDATFKGNTSRFLNHSCDPNCKLEKWQVDGETRVGVFASCSIEAGEPLTYDYRFVHFGPMMKCLCGASNCQGFLGNKKKSYQELLGSKSEKSTRVVPRVSNPQKKHLNGRKRRNAVIATWGCKRRRNSMVAVSSSKSMQIRH